MNPIFLARRGAPGGSDIGPALLTISWTGLTLSIIVVALRFYVRFSIVRRLRWDDWTVLLAVILGILNASTIQLAVNQGLGRHANTIKDSLQIMNAIKWDYISQPTCIMVPTFGRISLALLLLTFAGTSRLRRWLLWSIIAGQFVINCLTFIFILAQCRPIELLWDKSINGECWPLAFQEYFGYFQGSFNTSTDFILAICPAFVIWNLNMKLAEKISLIGLMGLGIFAMAASIVKTIKLKSVGSSNDYTYTTADTILWNTIEQYLAIIGASIATLKPLLRRITKSGYTSQNLTTSIGSYRMRSLRSKRVSQGHALAANHGAVLTDDGSSQTNILGPEHVRDADIWKTTTVKISVDNMEEATSGKS
ncbi:hypothetical protein BCR34DRAFT_609953 [Clohesyomyces aquaticus]|uniref:Rhodopsin domain-containing protein n=1 Tax=Clohesyomyces aquaticus TaxID=1231657 RepID=A0A1Y2A8Z0_9PLEO|nr:hypothetical protein BCR34DRAFT_609953 [Clohesyomyces aquaticus]